MATFRHRGKYWEVRIRRAGLLPIIKSGFTTKADAAKWAAITESELARGVWLDRTEAERNTLADLLKRYAEEISPNKKGGEVELHRIRRMLKDDLAKIKAAALSTRLVSEWRDQRLRQVSGSTVKRDLNLLSHVINTARMEWGIHIDNPVLHIRKPKENRPRSRRLSPAEEERLLDALEDEGRRDNGHFGSGARNIWIKPMVMVAIETAMRRSELLKLMWEDIDLDLQFARLHDTKNGESRDVPLSTRAISILQSLPRPENGRVFDTSADAVKKVFERARKRAGLSNLRFHDLRHEGISRLALRLPNVLELSSVTGHRDLQTLKRYHHPKASELAKKLG